MAKENKKHKDTVFVDLFYRDKSAKDNLLQMHYALFNEQLNSKKQIELLKLENSIFMELSNDVAYAVGNKRIVLNEHQSTVNYNMPLRQLLYIAREYEQYFPSNVRYRKNLVKIPTPSFFTFYNGTEERPREEILKLSDAFEIQEMPFSLELICRVININKEANHPLLSKCRPLAEYSELVATIRYFQKISETPIQDAVLDCINRNILKDYLSRKGSEVINMLIAEYNYDEDIRVQREESKAEGIAKGRAEGRAQEVYESVFEGDYSIKRGMEKLGITDEATFRRNAKIMGFDLPK